MSSSGTPYCTLLFYKYSQNISLVEIIQLIAIKICTKKRKIVASNLNSVRSLALVLECREYLSQGSPAQAPYFQACALHP